MQILIADIAVFNRIRKKLTVESISTMATDLAENGQIQAIAVRRPAPDDDPSEVKGKSWILVAGGRRLAGAAMNEWLEIRGDDLGEMTPYRRMKIELQENLGREEMHFADVAETKLRLHELYQQENPLQQISDTAEAIGESVANVSRDLQLAKALRTNPGLRGASSKKAALQSVKMAEYGRAKELEFAARGNGPINSIASRIETVDARVWLSRQDTGTFDLFLSDVPYGIDYFDLPVGEDLSRYDDSKSTTKALLTKCVPEMVRVTKETGWLALFTGWEGYFFVSGLMADCCTTHFQYRTTKEGVKKRYCQAVSSKIEAATCRFPKLPAKPWIWYRPNSRNNSMHPDLHAQNQYEPILVVNRGAGKIVSAERSGNVLVHDAVYADRIHDMQKPVPLGVDIIERLTPRGSLIADSFFGSGAFLAAAADASCDFRGCDDNPELRESAVGLVSMYYKGELTS